MGRKKKDDSMDYKPKSITYMEKRYENGINKKWINAEDGARMFSMTKFQFMKMAKKARANFIFSRTSVINLEILEKYLNEKEEAK